MKTENRNTKTEHLIEALDKIKKNAMAHPCFDADCFERRDIESLCAQGGDICAWTLVAIYADDGLRANISKKGTP